MRPLVTPWLRTEPSALLLVSEPESSIHELKQWIEMNHSGSGETSVSTLEVELGIRWTPQDFFFDLTAREAIPAPLRGNYDVVVCQSLLEHVEDPVPVLENLVALLKESSSILAIQTCNPLMSLHRFPIDTLRFFPDFFLAFGKARGLSTIVKQNGASIYAFFSLASFEESSIRSLEALF